MGAALTGFQAGTQKNPAVNRDGANPPEARLNCIQSRLKRPDELLSFVCSEEDSSIPQMWAKFPTVASSGPACFISEDRWIMQHIINTYFPFKGVCGLLNKGKKT